MRLTLPAAVLLMLSCSGLLAAERPRVDLSGAWTFYAQAGDAKTEVTAGPIGQIQVPGAWQAQGYGAPGGTIPSANIGPGTSPAEYLAHNLMGRCLYARDANIPAAWQGHRVFLCVRRAYRYTDLTVNGKRVGDYEGFCTPFEFDITDFIALGQTNRLLLGVDNRPRPGRDTLGTGNLYGNWGGIGGPVYLEARSPVYIDDVFAIPQPATSSALLRVTVKATSGPIPSFTLNGRIGPSTAAERADRWQASTNISGSDSNTLSCDLSIAMPQARLWTPDDPFLYVGQAALVLEGKVVDEGQVRFGMRTITAQGSKLFLNGKPLYLSGYGDDATEPLTGMLPADKSVYRQRLSLMRSLGFNFVRHHSCVPHDEYFEAADEVGMLVQPEAGVAYTGFWRTGHQLFEKEWPRIVRAFRNHPSIWAWCMGNELFLNELPEASGSGIALSKALASGPLEALVDEENGVFGPSGKPPGESFQRSNYYRDVEVMADGQTWSLLGQASTTRTFTDGPHELGLKFRSTRPAQVTKLRFFKVPAETGRHVGHIWDGEGRELARAEFANETLSGWQSASLPERLSLEANRKYVISVNANAAYGAVSGESRGITRKEVAGLLEKAYGQAKELDPTRLVHASDGGTPQPFTDVLSSGKAENARKPFLLHEYGTYCCSLPNLSLIPRLSGGVIRPLTYERAERFIREQHLESVYPQLVDSSLVMRRDAQKQYMESARASGSNAGYSFWLGVDFPDSPEGCWDEGILNQLWEPKPYLTNNLPDFNGPTVLLCSATLDSRSFYTDQAKEVGLRLWHYGSASIRDARLIWRVFEKDQVLQQGELANIECGQGESKPIGSVRIEPLNSTVPRFIRLELELRDGQRRISGNSWEFFAYPRPAIREGSAGVYSEAGPLPGATELKLNEPLPSDLRVLITRALRKDRHAELLQRGQMGVLLLGTGGFKESRAGYFLNQYGTGFGGIIQPHPVFDPIPHEGRLHLGLFQLVAGGGLLDTESMPPALERGAVVWGLRLTGWISPVKNLRKVAHVCDVTANNRFHLLLCNLDLLTDKPESRYVLARAIEYLLQPETLTTSTSCSAEDLTPLLLKK